MVMAEPMYNSYLSLIEDFLTVLRKDPFVMTILCMLCLFKERSGVVSREEIRRERTLFTELLDKYIDCRIKSRDWDVNKESIWNNIHRAMSHISSLKSLYENVALTAITAAHPLELACQNIPGFVF
jgi:hypothetical protein